MKVVPALPTIMEEVSVQTDTPTEVVVPIPEETTEIKPTLDAKRIERIVKNTPLSPKPVPKTESPSVAPEESPQLSNGVKAWKNFCHTTALLCGVGFIPSFAFVGLGIVALSIPAALFVIGIALTILGGEQTVEMKKARASRAESLRGFDYR